jgi:tetratricopeptide (TPR) repeat protein
MVRTASAAIIRTVVGLVLFGVLGTNAWSVEDVSNNEIAALIQQLGDPDFVERERAQAKLGDMGEKAYDALTTAVHNSDLEIAARARYLLLTIKLPALRQTDPERVKETMEGYENLPQAEQLQVVERLMRLPQGEGYRAACRLIHIENSVTMSKSIATTLLNDWPPHAEGRLRMREAVAEELTRSGRKVARWMTIYAKLDAAPETNIEAWRQIVDTEVRLLEERSPRTTGAVVASLLYDRAYWESECDEASDQGQKQFERAQAVTLNPSESAVYLYLDLATFYRNRGKIDWAAAVYSQVSTLGIPLAIPLAQLGLAEMLHDMGRNEEAVAALDVIAKLLETRRLQSLEYTSTGKVQGRRHFFLACQAKDRGEMEKHRVELLEAIKNDPDELDALIALYRIPDLEEEIRKRTITMIENAAELLRQEAAASPDSAPAHNQLAWLVGNTTGNMQEALDHALQAVELSPESGAYLDTLAHVYFYGLKDYETAVETQAKAVKFMPHSGLIVKKYELFRKAAVNKASE